MCLVNLDGYQSFSLSSSIGVGAAKIKRSYGAVCSGRNILVNIVSFNHF